MNSLTTIFLVAVCLMAATLATPNNSESRRGRGGNSINSKLKPSHWISASKLESLPALTEITIQQLEDMPLEDGAKLCDTMYHLSQIKHNFQGTYVPRPREIPVYIVKANGRNVSTTLENLPTAACQEPNFGDVETNIIITGLPQQTHTIRKETHNLINALLQRALDEYEEKKERYNKNRNNNNKQNKYDDYNDSSEEEQDQNDKKWSKSQEIPTPDVVVIAVAEHCNDLGCIAQMDVNEVGKTVAKVLTELTEKCDVPSETMTLIGQQNGAHIAGACGREYKQLNGQRIRRIVALDPSKKFGTNPNYVDGLTRGDADFVDAIHTSAYGLGSHQPVGDVDFFPNGPSVGVPGAKNVVDASMRATAYFAESVRRGNEHNFPAVAATSLKELRNTENKRKRAFMGLITKFDEEGIYMLEVNPKAPYGKRVVTAQQE